MEIDEAGYVDARPLAAENLRRLGQLRPAVPVLSLYLDLDPSELGTQRAHRSAYTSLLDEAHRRVEQHAADHDGRMSLRADVERAAAFFEDYRPKGGRGVAVFSATAARLFEPYTLPRAPRTRIVVDDSPFVTPLVRAADTRDWLIVLVDARTARFLHGNTDRVVEFERVEDDLAGQHERQGPVDHQRWVEHHVDQHLREAAGEVDRLLREHGFERVLLAGPPEIAPRFEQQMSTAARERLAGRFDVEVPDTVPDDVRRASIEAFEADERSHEREQLDTLAARLGRGERAVAGSEDVRAMLEQARVGTLLYAEACERAEPDVLEAAIEDAVAQSAEVLPIRHHPDELEPHGAIAALLRF